MRHKIKFASCLLGFACLIFAGILAAVHVVGTNPTLYFELQMKEHIPEYAGISEENLLTLDTNLSECLRGRELTNPEIEVFGEIQPAFNERELLHMEDCRQLFILLRRALAVSLIGSVILIAWGFDRKSVRLASGLAPLILLVPLGIFATWAVMDFNAAFNFFHKILFTNDLWLLNPRTDLLIRICPASMFMAMGVRIGILSALCALAAPLLGAILSIKPKEKRS